MSFNIANSGLNAITEQLNSISNNIANQGTAGYKSSRAEFAALYAQSQPLGVGVVATTQSISRGGAIVSTGNALDLAISGNGFFVVKAPNGGTNYTRAGYFGFDSDGNIINNMGMKLQGYPVDGSGNVQVGTVGDLTVTQGTMPAKATDNLQFTANFDARAKKPGNKTFDPTDKNSYNNLYTTQIFDSLGREHSVTQYFVKTADNSWQVHIKIDGESVKDPTTAIDLKFDNKGAMIEPTAKKPISKTIAGADSLSFNLDFSGSSQYGSEFSVSNNKASGFKSAESNGVQIDKDGSVYATYTNGERMLQGQLVLAHFTNPNGLQAQDGTTWMQTNSSGSPILGVPGSGMVGAIQSSAIEGSNVDLTAELVNLMTAQRNYQANTKVISTNDHMMQSLFQAL